MEKQNSKHNTLFIHMGPGLHAKIEAHQFSSKYPHIAFLDQPMNASFSELTDWTCDTIKRHAKLCEGKVKLLGHSFGGQLIAAAIPTVGDLVSEIRLLSSAYDSFDCFVNLQNTLDSKNFTSLQSWKSKSLEEKLNIILSISKFPQFSESYWVNLEAKQAYEKISTAYPPLDMNSFVTAFTDYQPLPPKSLKTAWPGKIKIYYSLLDNLIKTFEVVSPWKNIFPKAIFIEVSNIGHYGLFESSQLATDFFKDEPTLQN